MGCCESAMPAAPAEAIGDEEKVGEEQAVPGEISIGEDTEWVRLGGREIEEPLRSGWVALVRADWLVRHAESGGILQRRQELPAEAFVGLQELKRAGPAAMTFGLVAAEWLRVIVLSYPWLQPGHPDPHGESLRLIVQALKCFLQDSAYYENGGKPFGVLIDFVSLPQAPRTESDAENFKLALPALNLFYSHPHTMVLKVTTFPKGYPNNPEQKYELPPGANTVAYAERGWCFAESAMSGLIKDSNMVLDLGKLPRSELLWMVMHESKAGRPAPLHPTDFEVELHKKTFTSKGADFDKVAKLYAGAFERHLKGAKELNYSGLKWKADEVQKFVKAVMHNNSLVTVNLGNNSSLAEGAAALAEALEGGWVLESLNFESNGIGAEGAASFGRALRSNGRLRYLAMSYNRIGDVGAVALGEALAANTALESLVLKESRINDEGAAALAGALKRNRALQSLDLSSNDIRDQGSAAFAEAFKDNSTLELLDLERNFNMSAKSWVALQTAAQDQRSRTGGILLVKR